MLFEVKSVDANSPAQRAGIRKGDKIISINGEPLIDYVDYIYFCSKTKIKIRIKRNGEELLLRVFKNEGRDIGINFTRSLLGKKRICKNRCIFCFVDQLPQGMRKSLYLKDEDWRYSFLMGNFVTLSSIEKQELKRILLRKVSPLYISVHTVNEKLRRVMLGNKTAMPIRPLLKKLASKGIRFHSQAVICPGYNDGQELNKTIEFLFSLYPMAMTLAIVPVGLTGHRPNLVPIKAIGPKEAADIIKVVEKWQKECLNKKGARFVFAADELYIRAGLSLPDAQHYEGYAQLENGVGLTTKFVSEAKQALNGCRGKGLNVSVATGEDAYPFILEIAQLAQQNCGAKADVYPITNRTFGGGVSVTGLLGGADILQGVQGKTLGDMLLIHSGTLRKDGVFIDDMTLAGLSKTLGVPVVPIADGYEFINCICKGRCIDE